MLHTCQKISKKIKNRFSLYLKVFIFKLCFCNASVILFINHSIDCSFVTKGYIAIHFPIQGLYNALPVKLYSLLVFLV